MTKRTPAVPVPHNIVLTLTRVSDNSPAGNIQVVARQIIAYDQLKNHTRLRLTGSRSLEVQEGTARIDLMIRTAASRAGLDFRG